MNYDEKTYRIVSDPFEDLVQLTKRKSDAPTKVITFPFNLHTCSMIILIINDMSPECNTESARNTLPTWYGLEHGIVTVLYDNACHLIPHGEYCRSAAFIVAGNRKDIHVWIPRYRCKASGHTKSMTFQDILKMNSHYSIQFIGTVLDYYEKRAYYKLSVDSLCLKWNIAKSTLYRWKKMYPSGNILLSLFYRAILKLGQNLSVDSAQENCIITESDFTGKTGNRTEFFSHKQYSVLMT